MFRKTNLRGLDSLSGVREREVNRIVSVQCDASSIPDCYSAVVVVVAARGFVVFLLGGVGGQTEKCCC